MRNYIEIRAVIYVCNKQRNMVTMGAVVGDIKLLGLWNSSIVITYITNQGIETIPG